MHKGLLKRLNSVFIVAAVLAILFLVNVLADMLPWSYDMTAEKIFTLSDQTKTVLSNMDSEVNIVAFFEEGGEDQMVQTLLEEYKKSSNCFINVEYIDADQNPAAVNKYDENDEGISNGTIVFECNGKIKKINKSDIYILNDLAYGKAFNGEQQFTGAIIHVNSEDLPKVYFLEGHKEPDLNENLSKLKARLEGEGHVVESLNILKAESIPEDADTIIIVSPKKDIGDDERDKLKEFLIRGGRMICLFDIMTQDNQFVNLNNLLKSYGIQFSSNFVVEEDSNSFYANNKMYLVPYYNIQNTIVEKLNTDRLFVLLPFSSNIEIMNDIDRTVTVEKLLVSSEQSWIRYDINDATSTKTASDFDGPATLAVAISKDNTDLRYEETKMVIAGNAVFVDNEYIDIQGNFDFLMNSLNWVEDRDDSITIRPKSINTNSMFVKGEMYTIVLIISIVVVPMIAFAIGLVVWLRRRHQ
jgi:ABC-type uncharacterized transport system involved in gliding motility auxiliary subunit